MAGGYYDQLHDDSPREIRLLEKREGDLILLFYQFMATYKELHPKINKPRYLWHIGYYDGPTSGVCDKVLLETDGKEIFDLIVYSSLVLGFSYPVLVAIRWAMSLVQEKRRYYFELVDEVWTTLPPDEDDPDDDGEPVEVRDRYFLVRKLKPEAISELEEQLSLFQKYVGNNTTYYYDDEGKFADTPERFLYPREEWTGFYGALKKPIDLSGKIVAWFCY